MTTDDSAPLLLRPGAAPWREAGGEAIVLDLEASAYLSLNRSGTLIWTQLAGGTTRRRLVELLVDTYGIDDARAEADVDAFVAACRSRDLLAP